MMVKEYATISAVIVSIIIPTFNSARFLEHCLNSLKAQELPLGVTLEVLVMDGGSLDKTPEIVKRFGYSFISEPDKGPADAINKGFARASGELIGWLNSDDTFSPTTIARFVSAYLIARRASAKRPPAFIFGSCRIVDEDGKEIRQRITRFKELFFPFSSRQTHLLLNYVSQPASIFVRDALLRAGSLDISLKAAFDYDLFLRLWREGRGIRIRGKPLADFRWYGGSISGENYRRQFEEEFSLAQREGGKLSLAVLGHWFVKWGIILIYNHMTQARKRENGI